MLILMEQFILLIEETIVYKNGLQVEKIFILEIVLFAE
jgi:hypothetical protein